MGERIGDRLHTCNAAFDRSFPFPRSTSSCEDISPRTLEFDIAGFDLKDGEGKGLGINWKIYLVIDCQERGRFVRKLASFRCKEKSNLHARYTLNWSRLHSTLSGKHAKRASHASLFSFSSLRYAFRECVPTKFSLPRFDQRTCIVYSFLAHFLFRLLFSFSFTSMLRWLQVFETKRCIRDLVKIDENCTSRSTPLRGSLSIVVGVGNNNDRV